MHVRVPPFPSILPPLQPSSLQYYRRSSLQEARTARTCSPGVSRRWCSRRRRRCRCGSRAAWASSSQRHPERQTTLCRQALTGVSCRVAAAHAKPPCPRSPKRMLRSEHGLARWSDVATSRIQYGGGREGGDVRAARACDRGEGRQAAITLFLLCLSGTQKPFVLNSRVYEPRPQW
jgi:hypothetical protein